MPRELGPLAVWLSVFSTCACDGSLRFEVPEAGLARLPAAPDADSEVRSEPPDALTEPRPIVTSGTRAWMQSTRCWTPSKSSSRGNASRIQTVRLAPSFIAKSSRGSVFNARSTSTAWSTPTTNATPRSFAACSASTTETAGPTRSASLETRVFGQLRGGKVCPSGETCTRGLCFECHDNTTCFRDETCDLAIGHCAQCVPEAPTCPGESPFCDPYAAGRSHNGDRCMQCLSSADCPANLPLCDLHSGDCIIDEPKVLDGGS